MGFNSGFKGLKCIIPTAYVDRHSRSGEAHSCLVIKQFPFPMWSDHLLPYFLKNLTISVSLSFSLLMQMTQSTSFCVQFF